MIELRLLSATDGAMPDSWMHCWKCSSATHTSCHLSLCLFVPCLHYQDADGWATWLCLLIVHHSKLLKPFYNLLQSPHFRRSQAVLNTNQCACQEKCNPIYSAQAAKVCLGLLLWHFPSAAGVCTFIDWYGPENTISLSPMILMRMPEVCILRVFKMLQNFVMK